MRDLLLPQGPFEAMELCDAMNITCIITLFGGMTGETGHAAKRCADMEHPPDQVCSRPSPHLDSMPILGDGL